jgi:triosephosphate isomerase (TIM)
LRTPLIVANWKLYKTVRETLAFVSKFISLTGRVYDKDIVLCPPFTALYSAGKELSAGTVKLGAQNLFYEEKGAFTGEISPEMLKEVGCSYVIIGHSERRKYFSETDKTINLKIKKAEAYGLTPVICIGEGEEERDKGKTREVLSFQMNEALIGFTASQVEKFVIAYEPIWAIGTGKIEKPEQTSEVIEYLRNLLSSQYGYSVASKVRFLYGGSVKPENSASFLSQKEIDGLLVGGASLDPESFARICKG